jgi:site-specific recombinase XerD
MRDANGELRAWVSRFLDWLSIEKGYSRNTVLSYGYDLERYREFLEENLFLDIAQAQPFNIREYLFHLRSRGLSTRSMERHLAAIKQFHRFLCREGYLKSDCTSISNFKV